MHFRVHIGNGNLKFSNHEGKSYLYNRRCTDMPRKTLDDYIDQYGEEDGLKRYERVQRTEATKAKKYAA